MTKQYVISFKNTNPRLSQTTRYLSEIRNDYPYKTSEIEEATVFETKTKAYKAITDINQNNLYHIELNIVSK